MLENICVLRLASLALTRAVRSEDHSSLAMLTLSLADLLSICSRAIQSERLAKIADAATAKMLIAAYIAEFGDGTRIDAT